MTFESVREMTEQSIYESETQRMATLLHKPELAKDYLKKIDESHWQLNGNKWLWAKYQEHVAAFKSAPTFKILRTLTEIKTKDDPEQLHKIGALQLLDNYEKQNPLEQEYFGKMMMAEARSTKLREELCPLIVRNDWLGVRKMIDAEYKSTANLPTKLDLKSLVTKPSSDTQNLLNEWALERQAIMAIVAPTGIGKSVMAMQLATHFACGRETIGFNPHRPLRVLVIQNEDSDNDIANMRDGAMSILSDTEKELAYENLSFIRLRGSAGDTFLANLDSYCEQCDPDIVFINPLLKYFGGDPLNVKEVSKFLNELEPILERHNCGLILVHHTIKQSKSSRQNQVDSSYSGFGSSAWSNSVRDTIEIRASNVDGYYKLITGKRSSKWTWKERFIKRSDNRNLPCWFDVNADEIKRLLKEEKTTPQSSENKEKLFALFEPSPATTTIKQLITDSGMSDKTIRTHIKSLLDDGRIAWQESSNGDKAIRYYRTDGPKTNGNN